ncbi:MAG: hypothetical protein PHI19_00140 [Clostridia bacterium]|nr:hypothetical protein [Clostridia bacterium]
MNGFGSILESWYLSDKFFRTSDGKAVVKMYDGGGRFANSVIMPTSLYPLNGVPRVFHHHNTSIVDDMSVLSAFDAVSYKIGRCYDNNERVVEELRLRNVSVFPYAGWAFIGKNQLPVHHSWAVVGNSVIDLADDYTLLASGRHVPAPAENESIDKMRLKLASFFEITSKFKNSVRCSPVGVPTPFMLYVGAPCEPSDARKTYQALMREYPRHEAQRNVDPSGFNATQRIFYDKGLM